MKEGNNLKTPLVDSKEKDKSKKKKKQHIPQKLNQDPKIQVPEQENNIPKPKSKTRSPNGLLALQASPPKGFAAPSRCSPSAHRLKPFIRPITSVTTALLSLIIRISRPPSAATQI